MAAVVASEAAFVVAAVVAASGNAASAAEERNRWLVLAVDQVAEWANSVSAVVGRHAFAAAYGAACRSRPGVQVLAGGHSHALAYRAAADAASAAAGLSVERMEIVVEVGCTRPMGALDDVAEVSPAAEGRRRSAREVSEVVEHGWLVVALPVDRWAAVKVAVAPEKTAAEEWVQGRQLRAAA